MKWLELISFVSVIYFKTFVKKKNKLKTLHIQNN